MRIRGVIATIEGLEDHLDMLRVRPLLPLMRVDNLMATSLWPSFSSTSSSSSSSSSPPPELPTTCCMSGCANCVWLEYAEQLVSYYRSKGSHLGLEALLKQIEVHIDDQMVKAFVTMEIKSHFKHYHQPNEV